MKIDPIVKKILDELKFKPEDCLWEKHGATCMKHRYIEIAGQNKGVVINALEEIEKNSEAGVVAIKCTASLGKLKVITYGEATPKNNKNSYPYAMAEKRSIDRAILKLIGVHGFIHSEDEVEAGFNNEIIKREFPKAKTKTNGKEKKIDDLEINTTLEVIQNSIDKGELKNLMFKVEKLKSDIHKSGSWDSFTKTNEFKKLNKMSHTIRTNINQQRRK